MRKLSILIVLFIGFSCAETVKNDDLLVIRMIELEDQVQRMNTIQLYRGDGFVSDVKAEFASVQRNEDYKLKADKLKIVFDAMEKIDAETNDIIALLEKYKMDLLKSAGENTTSVINRDPASIVWKKFENRPGLNQPSRLNLAAVQNKTDTESVNAFFVDTDGIQPSAIGRELWTKLNVYRAELVHLTGSYAVGSRSFEIHPTDINSYSSNDELVRKVRGMIENSKANAKEDLSVLIDLYIMVTKPEQLSFQGTNMHWVSATFKDNSLIGALAALTSLEQDILSARVLALANWKSKIATCGYSFDTIMPIATGPSTAIEGEEIQIKVLMAAFDSNNQPTVTTTSSGAQIEYRSDGIGIIKMTPQPGLNTIKGTVAIRDKSGVEKIEEWEWTIDVKKK